MYLSVYLSMYLSVYLSMYLSMYLSVYLSMYLSVRLSINLIIHNESSLTLVIYRCATSPVSLCLSAWAQRMTPGTSSHLQRSKSVSEYSVERNIY